MATTDRKKPVSSFYESPKYSGKQDAWVIDEIYRLYLEIQKSNSEYKALSKEEVCQSPFGIYSANEDGSMRYVRLVANNLLYLLQNRASMEGESKDVSEFCAPLTLHNTSAYSSVNLALYMRQLLMFGAFETLRLCKLDGSALNSKEDAQVTYHFKSHILGVEGTKYPSDPTKVAYAIDLSGRLHFLNNGNHVYCAKLASTVQLAGTAVFKKTDIGYELESIDDRSGAYHLNFNKDKTNQDEPSAETFDAARFAGYKIFAEEVIRVVGIPVSKLQLYHEALYQQAKKTQEVGEPQKERDAAVVRLKM